MSIFPMNKEGQEEVRLRTQELRSSLDRSSSLRSDGRRASLRRISYLSTALHKMVEQHPRSVFPETWEVLDRIQGEFGAGDMARAIFDAEEVDDGRFQWDSPISGEPKPAGYSKPDFLR